MQPDDELEAMRAKAAEATASAHFVVVTADNLAAQVDLLDWKLGGSHAVFRSGSRLVRVLRWAEVSTEASTLRRPPESLVAWPVTPNMVRLLVSRAERVWGFLRIAPKLGRPAADTDAKPATDDKQKWIDCPQTAANTFVDTPEWKHVARLRGIARWPLMRPDFSFAAASGYDAATGYFVDIDGRIQAELSTSPVAALSKDEVRRLVDELLADELRDFAFATDEDKAAYLAALLTPLVRPLCDCIPFFIFDAPQVGTGKTTAAQALGTIYTGEPLAANSLSGDEEERRKAIFSLLLAADAFVLFDNVKGTIGGPMLAGIATSAKVAGRLLGTNTSETVDAKCMMIFTSNNASVDADLARRSLMVRFDAGVENTMTRAYAYPDINATLAERRARILRILMTWLASYGAARDKPSGLSAFASYGEWARLVRDPVVWLGFPDFVQRAADEFATADPEQESLAEVLALLVERFGVKKRFSARGVLTAVRADLDEEEAPLGESLRGLTNRVGREPLTAKALGWAFKNRRDRIAGGLVLRGARNSDNAMEWWVDRIEGGPKTMS